MSYNIQDIAQILSGDAMGQAESRARAARANVSQFQTQQNLIESLNEIISGAEDKAGKGSLLTSIASSSILAPLVSAAVLAIPGVRETIGPSIVNAIAAAGTSYGTEQMRLSSTDWDKNIKQFIKDNKGTKIGQLASDTYSQLKSSLEGSATTGAIFDAVSGGLFPSDTGKTFDMFGTKEVVEEVTDPSGTISKVTTEVPRTLKDYLLDEQGILTGYTKGSDKGIVKNIVEDFKDLGVKIKEADPGKAIEDLLFETQVIEEAVPPDPNLRTMGSPAVTKTSFRDIGDILKDIIPGDIDKTKQALTQTLTKAPETGQSIIDFITKIDPVAPEVPSFLEGIIGKSLGLDKKMIKGSANWFSKNPNLIKALKSVAPTLVSHNFSLDPHYSPIKYLTGTYSKPQFRNPYGSIGGY